MIFNIKKLCTEKGIIGLRLQGSDGKYRGWLTHDMAGTLKTVKYLSTYFCVDAVIDHEGNILPDNTLVKLGESKIKTILYPSSGSSC